MKLQGKQFKDRTDIYIPKAVREISLDVKGENVAMILAICLVSIGVSERDSGRDIHI